MNKFAHLQEWFKLPDITKIRLFAETSRQVGLPSSSAVEKDWWVVHTLAVIFSMDCANALIFKGGTSLSKGWNVIQRFSEDIDLALDREFLGFSGELTKGDIKKLRRKSFEFISEIFTKDLRNKFVELGFVDIIVKPREVENHDQDPLIIEIYYKKLTETDTYLKPGVLVEVGSRSLKEPFTHRTFGTFIYKIYSDDPFSDNPITIPVVNPERTFLEKIFLLHEEFQKPLDKIRVERLSRHLYDIEKLSQTEYAEIALQDKKLYNTIVKHRSKFTAISGIDYAKHNPENIKFTPPETIIKKWEDDYNQMKDSMIYGQKLDFNALINRLTELQKRINELNETHKPEPIIENRIKSCNFEKIKKNKMAQLEKSYYNLIENIGLTLKKRREKALQAVHYELLSANWEIGKYIVEFEQNGNEKAEYGSSLLARLSKDLKIQFGKGFSQSKIYLCRKFYLDYPIFQTVSGKLSWSHYAELLTISDNNSRDFYENQAVKENWSIRELRRQINSSLYERLALSKDKDAVLKLSEQGQIINTPKDIIKDPYVFEFLGLPEQDIIREKDLEEKLIDNLQHLLLELGKGFSFVARQFRVTIDNQHYFIDLVFYHRILKCFVLIDLKTTKVKHQDIGQMNLYLNYFKEEENIEDDNAPIGIIIAKDKNEFLVKYATGGISNNIFVSKYQLYLPDKKLLEEKVNEIIGNE